MNIQSLSVVVPSKKCINNCAFCVSRMKTDEYINQKEENIRFYDLYERDYMARLEFARDNGCNTIMLTGDSEPQQNRNFLMKFGSMHNNISRPFRWIEMQTTGVLMDDEYLRFLRNHVRVTTISVSISSFANIDNCAINGTPEKCMVDIQHLCSEIKRYDFNLRLSINLTSQFDQFDAENMLDYCKKTLQADQVTFRKLYTSGKNTPQDTWIEENAASEELVRNIRNYIIKNGVALELLPFGAIKYSINGMGIVLDDDCMSKNLSDGYKYLILRPNCKLYSKWDDPGSLIF